jgi:hypothetical protein
MELTLEGSKTFRNSKTFQNLGRNVPEGPKDSKMFPKKPIPMSTLPALNPSTPTLVSDLPVAPQASPMGAIDPAGLPDLVPLSATLAPKPIANPEGARRVRPRPDEAPMSRNELKAQNWTDDQKVRYMIHYDKKARLWREAQKWVATRIFHMDTGKLEATFFGSFNMAKFIAECTNEKLKDYLSEIIVGDQNEKDLDFNCDNHASSAEMEFLMKVLKQSKYFDLQDHIDETFSPYDEAGRGAQGYFTYPMETEYILNLYSANWHAPLDPVKKWVQVMAFNADESESDEPFFDEDRALAYKEEQRAAKKQRGAGSSRDA